MDGEIERDKPVDDVDDDDVETIDPEETIVMSDDLDDDDNDISLEINVDKLVAKIDADNDAAHKKDVHRRLEELEEKRRVESELDSTYNFNLDDEL